MQESLIVDAVGGETVGPSTSGDVDRPKHATTFTIDLNPAGECLPGIHHVY